MKNVNNCGKLPKRSVGSGTGKEGEPCERDVLVFSVLVSSHEDFTEPAPACALLVGGTRWESCLHPAEAPDHALNFHVLIAPCAGSYRRSLIKLVY